MLLAVRVVGWTHLESLQSTQEARITRLRLEQLLQHSYLQLDIRLPAKHWPILNYSVKSIVNIEAVVPLLPLFSSLVGGLPWYSSPL